jgi:integrative and conjugative element protein (TIGR02256 family)
VLVATLIKVQIERIVRESMLAITSATRPLEVGGVLLGRIQPGLPTIVDLIGPGPLARATATSFEPDYEYQQAEVDRLFQDYGSDLAYLGDWHSHPGGRCHPSVTDLRAMLAIRGTAEAQCPDPVMVIVGGPRNRTTKAFAFDGLEALAEVPMCVVG